MDRGIYQYNYNAEIKPLSFQIPILFHLFSPFPKGEVNSSYKWNTQKILEATFKRLKMCCFIQLLCLSSLFTYLNFDRTSDLSFFFNPTVQQTDPGSKVFSEIDIVTTLLTLKQSGFHCAPVSHILDQKSQGSQPSAKK